jgi:U3 small nucleolar RNA-associated protein MPP10
MDPLTVAESLPSRLPDFVAPHAGLRDAVAALAQEIYSMAMKRPYASTKPAKRPLPSLITEGLDAEQIWEELGLLMKPTLNKASSDVETQAQQVSQVASPSEDESTADDLDDEEEDEDDFDDMDAEEADFHEDDYDEEEDDDEENEEDEEEEEEDDEMEGGSKPKRMLSSADPESEFFSVDDMQKFVDAYDSEPHSNVDEDEDDEDEEDGEGEDGEEDDMANATYERFYGKEQSKPKPKAQPQPKDKEVAAKKQPVPKTKPAKDDGKKKDLFADDQEDDEAEGDKEETSRFGRQIADIRSKIAQLEEENLGPREWALRGEASARDRPANSLVEADMDYDALKLHKRSVTQDVNQSLEALILGRIKARLWNDVERIEDNDDSAVAKALGDGVQDAKSSKSLSQLYEEEVCFSFFPFFFREWFMFFVAVVCYRVVVA